MAWQEINLENAKINMSKVIPYDSSLSVLDKKQGYYHNNRLSALNEFKTNSAAGYKCYKRKADQSNLVDDELTDYIEINKVNDDGTLTHLMDISDTYYRAESTGEYVADAKAKAGIVINDTYLGSYKDWQNYNIYILSNDIVLAIPKDESQLCIYAKLLHTKDAIPSNNFESKDVILAANPYIFNTPEAIFFFDSIGEVNSIFNVVTTSVSQPDKTVSYKGIALFKTKFSKTEAEITATRRSTRDNPKYYINCYLDIHWNDGWGSNSLNLLFAEGRTINNKSTSGNKNKIEISTAMRFYNGFDEKIISDTLTLELSSTDTIYPSFTVGGSAFTGDFWGRGTLENGSLKPSDLMKYNSGDYASIKMYFGTSYMSAPVKEFVLWDGSTGTTPQTQKESIFLQETIKDGQKTVDLSNGFVLNHINGIEYSIGHNYKTIARFDVQGSSYLGYDSDYVYVTNANQKYRISLAKMFADTPYNTEVNLIESAYCKRYNGYKIFNTTTYWNTLYNDEKILCSCDDWNGRYMSSKTDSDNRFLATSRIGHFWDKNSGDIPAVAISDELPDILEYENCSYEWNNPGYTIHKGVAAFIYKSDSTQTDTMIQRVVITSDGFQQLKDETKIFTHNTNAELIPSILFSDALKSDIYSYVKVGAEIYKLKSYAYMPSTIALVYAEIPEIITLDQTAASFILQGTVYFTGGPKDNRVITDEENRVICNITGLKYIGYDTAQAYFFSSATATIYTFTGDNKLSPFLDVDKRTPYTSLTGEGITVCNIPSINLVAMAFNDGVLIILNEQAIFIEIEAINEIFENREFGVLKINGSYFYFGNNYNFKNLIEIDGSESKNKLLIKTSKIGFDRKTNTTMSKQRLCVYSDNLEKGVVKVTITSRLGNKINTETYTKTIQPKEFIDNEFQWEFNQKFTKANWFTIECELDNLDLLNHYVEMSESTEENLVR